MKKFSLFVAGMIITVPVFAQLPATDSIKKARKDTLEKQMESYWAGANISSLGYNFSNGGAGSENIVGGATLVINRIEKTHLFGGHWSIIGNIGNFLAGAPKPEDISKSVTKLSQSGNGLSIGMGGAWGLTLGKDNELNYRLRTNALLRLNSYSNTGPDSTSVSLPQLRLMAGFEFEGFNLEEDGKVHFSVMGSWSAFSKDSYEKVFNKRRGSLLSMEAIAILPLSGRFGVLVSGTYAQLVKPVYQVGLVVQPQFRKKEE